ncbi:DNA-3-methyladenine glycosylase I [Enterococcus haemoperoxidus ATCC BAA-382]|uniref:DNA-3-methyladenine glycosylase I n=2 Tax=Enterococcus TaxID=1350 RepID=R2QF04_9ENTE|nr:DNA-3-methyladenine glycosylase I [Enterococcus haemoperoxidus]EOH95067.1 DNA-3-methyladenine glycosylase I [Enterococcus haemoperoxidus ATCC BAA-382]EOT60466.1 DNA-3-methyladenine glycosylase I [Enterococcus haemoperoxidus ATCC BAA-382]
MEKVRCDWANGNELEAKYHDEEWGTAEHTDQKLFEMLILESMQAGLSWSTILKKRETLTKAYDQFDYVKIAEYTQEKIDSLLADPGIIRNKLKVNAAINNAKVFMEIQVEHGSFDQFIWSYVDHKPIKNRWKNIKEVPASTELSDKISKDLKKKGFKFLGTTTVYAFMQATGMVDDHLAYCFKCQEDLGVRQK